MIFDCGLEKAMFECECGRTHYGVSIGEETVLCGCGALLTFEPREKFYEYFWLSEKLCRARIEQVINSDKRNLC